MSDSKTIAVSGMFEDYFLDYASYVILERAVPGIIDGLKPVQRRILHAMYEMDDGRFNKAANVIGSTMQYHPHGDQAIGAAMVNMGQKELLLDTQGNWGDVRTGDSAAAPRYIEVRLSKFALEVLFNPQTTHWQLSYDGRKREPIDLPAKFPLLLAMGVEGIAVGLSTRILPHNFIELANAAIQYLKNPDAELILYPDFPTGGYIDVSNYQSGKKGSKVKVRARIEEKDSKTLLIKDVPFGVTTTKLIESVIKASDAGKIKIKKVTDNTAAEVEIEIQLPPGTSPDITIHALYAFTDCEVSISPNACVIVGNKPHFLSVIDILKLSVNQTKELLRQELLIKLRELQDRWHYSSLEKIFIENRIYRDIEECETWEAVLQAIDDGLEPFKKLLQRPVIQEDLIRLTEIKIKRISRFDSFKADELIKAINDDITQTQAHLNTLNDFTIAWYQNLLKKYGKGRERKTEIRSFESIQASIVAVANQKLYVNRAEGFIGFGIKKDEYVEDCSDIDDIIAFREDGTFTVVKIQEKVFVGKNIVHVAVFKKGDERKIYHVLYTDFKLGITRAKRFAVTAITREKSYNFMGNEEKARLQYFSANPNSESEIITITLLPSSKARIKVFDFDFGSIAIKGRASQGNIITRQPIKKVQLKQKGYTTLGGREIWYDENIGRLNTDNRGKFLGSFDADDSILVVHTSGHYELTTFELTNRYEAEHIASIDKYYPNLPIAALYFDSKSSILYLKRFFVETTTLKKKFLFIPEGKEFSLIAATSYTSVEFLGYKTAKSSEPEYHWPVSQFETKGWKALGYKLADRKPFKVQVSDPDLEQEKRARTSIITQADSPDASEELFTPEEPTPSPPAPSTPSTLSPQDPNHPDQQLKIF